MKEETIIFVPPDKDHFEKQKGKTLNNWIKQNIKVQEEKQNFETVASEYKDIVKRI